MKYTIHSFFLSLSLGLFSSVLSAAPVDEVELRDLFENQCAECHSPGDEEPLLHANVDLSALSNSEYISYKKPQDSELFERVALPSDHKKRMPDSRGSVGDDDYRRPLTTSEQQLISDWIQDGLQAVAAPSLTGAAPVNMDGASPSSLQALRADYSGKVDPLPEEDAAKGSGPRPFVTSAEVLELISEDLKQGGRGEHTNWRYLSLANYWNRSDISTDQIELYGKAISKLANSLSWEKEIVIPESLDDRGIVFRIDARHYGFRPQVWKTLLKHYPYGVELNNRVERDIETLTGEPAVMRADWWVYALSQPPIYYEVLGIPGPGGFYNLRDRIVAESRTAMELEYNVLGIDMSKEAKAGNVLRKGFGVSEVSQGGRVVERLGLPNGGYYWKSFDFNPDRSRIDRMVAPSDIFAAPLGPPEYGLATDPWKRFVSDGSEIVFSLPNGLQAYLLTGPAGERIDVGPFQVVQDSRHPRGTIIAGMSCMRCHDRGLKSESKGDEIYATSTGAGLNAQERSYFEMLYGQPEKLSRLMREDMESYQEALEKCGAASSREPVGELYFQYLDDIPIEQINSEFETDRANVSDILAASGDVRVRSGAKRGNYPRFDLREAFAPAAVQLGLGVVRDFVPLDSAEQLGESAESVNLGGRDAGLLLDPKSLQDQIRNQPERSNTTRAIDLPSASGLPSGDSRKSMVDGILEKLRVQDEDS